MFIPEKSHPSSSRIAIVGWQTLSSTGWKIFSHGNSRSWCKFQAHGTRPRSSTRNFTLKYTSSKTRFRTMLLLWAAELFPAAWSGGCATNMWLQKWDKTIGSFARHSISHRCINKVHSCRAGVRRSHFRTIANPATAVTRDAICDFSRH